MRVAYAWYSKPVSLFNDMAMQGNHTMLPFPWLRMLFILFVTTPLFQRCSGVTDHKVESIIDAPRGMMNKTEQDTDPKLWSISFPSTYECDKLLDN